MSQLIAFSTLTPHDSVDLVYTAWTCWPKAIRLHPRRLSDGAKAVVARLDVRLAAGPGTKRIFKARWIPVVKFLFLPCVVFGSVVLMFEKLRFLGCAVLQFMACGSHTMTD